MTHKELREKQERICKEIFEIEGQFKMDESIRRHGYSIRCHIGDWIAILLEITNSKDITLPK